MARVLGHPDDLSNVDAKMGTRFNDAFVFIGRAEPLSLANANGAVGLENPKEKAPAITCRGFTFWLLDLGSNQGPTD